MHFTKSLLIGAAAIVAVIAQSSPIAFTSTPASVTAGQSVTLRWGGGNDNQPVTITLKRGDTNNLQTVALITGKPLATLSRVPIPKTYIDAGSATGNSFTWSVPSSLPNGDDYALQINQGVDDVNYSGRFSLSGGSTVTSSSSTSAMAASALTATTSAPTSASAIIQSALASQNSSVTTTVVAATNATTTMGGSFGTGAVGSGAVGSGANGAVTGTTMHRNTTMSKPTLKSTSSSVDSTSAAATTTGGSAGTTTGSSSTSAPTSGAMDAASYASPLALILSAVAAIMYLG
ncbi:MAG: hypothetical protein Q9170_000359 [Blastenia crenularia]